MNRRDDGAADVDVRADVLARVADEGGGRDRGRQAAIRDLACERLHLRRGRRDVDRRNVPRRLRRVLQPRDVGAERLAGVLKGFAAKDAPDDLHRLAHRPERALAVQARVVEEDLRGSEPEQKPPRAGGLLHDPRVHSDLDGMPSERRDDSPSHREAFGLDSDQGGDDRRRARFHPVLSPPRVRLGEPDGVQPGAIHHPGRLEHLFQRLHRQLHHADAKGAGHQDDLLTRVAP